MREVSVPTSVVPTDLDVRILRDKLILGQQLGTVLDRRCHDDPVDRVAMDIGQRSGLRRDRRGERQ